jgi:hypothetical protein
MFPLVGSILTDTAESAVTGKANYNRSFDLFPVVTHLGSAAKAVGKEDFEGAAWEFAYASAIELGLPYSGTKELQAAVKDGELHPEAFLGQRE